MLSNTKSMLSKSSIFLILAIFACQGTAAQETKAKGEYASVNGLKMYYETGAKGKLTRFAARKQYEENKFKKQPYAVATNN